jgi:VIT1/CCC1 family predicted Fe2+/Mn2+ transporter
MAAIAGALSMAVGSYLASRAQRQLYESEVANEQREIKEKPGEEMAELLAALIGRGMPRHEASEVMRRIAAHPGLMLEMLGALELGLVPGSLGSPTRDALVTGIAFVVGSAVPLLPFLVLEIKPALIVTMFLALGALFARGNEGLAFRATNGCEWAGSVAAGWSSGCVRLWARSSRVYFFRNQYLKLTGRQIHLCQGS